MIKFTQEQFIEELMGEMNGYEEITKEHKDVFLAKLDQYITTTNDKNKRISKSANSITIKLEDESELFDIIDRYFAAIVNEELDLYWANWKL
ncbi:MAG: hypothetical protein CVU84_05430 [Firmicutes bacterium HGW-Firmicutes-1]|jgi:uncharacterized FlgJ-related protein|nr:MAG: hypothetical protein CVU84_05430 [Firmicutes bacterium HGW-Firmicutes-1]